MGIKRIMGNWLLAAALLALLLPGCSDDQDDGLPQQVDYLIVAADDLSASAQRYKDFRQGTGHRVKVTLVGDLAAAGSSTAQRVAKIREHVKQQFEARDQQRPFYLLLLGDGQKALPAGDYYEPYDRSHNTSDNVYADINGDHIPDLAVGRIPAADDAEADQARAKIAAYERDYKVGPWNRRLNLFASTGDFGATIDTVIEKVALEIADSISYNYDVSMTYGSQQSEFVYVPEKFSDMVYERINQGSLFSAYIGHGDKTRLDQLKWSGKKYPILDLSQLSSKLKVRDKAPILFIVACWTGAFDDKDALAERILRMPDAPPAVIASTEISHPYTNAILVRELGVLATEHTAPNVGLLLQWGKYRLVRQKDKLREQLYLLGQVMLKKPEIEALNRTHLHMYELFGDPAMPLRYVQGKATVTAPASGVKRGATLAASASFSNLSSGQARFTLECRRKELLGNLKPVPKDGDPQRDAVIKANYRAANNKVVVSATGSISGGEASVSLKVPASVAAGDYVVKVYADDGEADAMGHAQVKLLK